MPKNIKIEGYDVLKKIGSGSFGVVYKCKKKDSDKIYAIKVEDKKKNTCRVDHEMKIYKKLENDIGFPKIYNIIRRKNETLIVMDYLGPSLEDLFEFCDYSFSLKTVLMISIQVLNRIEILHNIGYLHRDIKPDNFLIGTGTQKGKIFMIDLGLSKMYMINDTHIEHNSGKSFTGSFRYSSLRNHKGIEQSRRDDLESIGFMLIYFLLGRLPWQGLKGSTKSKRSQNIFECKNNIELSELCSKLPKEFLLYMKYSRILQFDQKPDYSLLRDLFINLFRTKNYELDFVYDWNIAAKKKKENMIKLDN